MFFIEFIIVVCLISRNQEVVVAFDLYKYIYIYIRLYISGIGIMMDSGRKKRYNREENVAIFF